MPGVVAGGVAQLGDPGAGVVLLDVFAVPALGTVGEPLFRRSVTSGGMLLLVMAGV